MITTQRWVFALSIAICISGAITAALTPGNLLLSRFTKTIDNAWGIVEIDEFTPAGILVQTIATGCLLSDNYAGGLSYNQDYTSVAIACFDQNGGSAPNASSTPIVVVAIKPDGSIDKTYIPIELLPETNPMSAMVDGRRVWLGTDNYHFVYAKRNGQVINTDVIMNNTQTMTDMYMHNDVFYVGGYVSNPFFVGSIDGGVPLGDVTVTPVITNQASPNPYAGTDPNRFYIYSPEEIYGTTDNGKVFKIYLNQSSGEWLSYSAPIGINTAATGVVALDTDTTRMVYAIIGYNVVWKMEDAGTEFQRLDEVKTVFNQVVMDLEFIKAPLATCSDNIINQDETDLDCGGYSCKQCNPNQKCVVDEDCLNGYCNGTCVAFTCNDLIQNQNETDVDCGGPNCDACPADKKCSVGYDCDSGVCTENTCKSPACNDAVKNGQETDVDCGGPTCIVCNIGKKCLVNSDCSGNFCDDNICSPPIPISVPTTPVTSQPVNEPLTSDGTTPSASTTPVAQTPRSKLVSDSAKLMTSTFFIVLLISLVM